MLKNISNHTHLSRITLDYQEENSGRRSWFPHLRKTPEKIYHMEGKRYLSALPKFSSSIPLCEHFSSDFLSTTPAFMPLDSWTAESDGPQPILTGGRNEGGSPSSGSSSPSLLPNSPPTCDRDPRSQISVFHFHLLGELPPLAGIEAVISRCHQIISPHLASLPGTSWNRMLNLREVPLHSAY